MLAAKSDQHQERGHDVPHDAGRTERADVAGRRARPRQWVYQPWEEHGAAVERENRRTYNEQRGVREGDPCRELANGKTCPQGAGSQDDDRRREKADDEAGGDNSRLPASRFAPFRRES